MMCLSHESGGVGPPSEVGVGLRPTLTAPPQAPPPSTAGPCGPLCTWVVLRLAVGRGSAGFCPLTPSLPPTALLLHRYVVARVIWADMLSIAVTYFITLCLFPGLESEIRHCVLGEWLPILIMAVFNLSDFVGKVGCLPCPCPRGWGRGCYRWKQQMAMGAMGEAPREGQALI